MNEPKTPSGAKLLKVSKFWVSLGCSWQGRTTKRDGEVVSCKHKHRTESGAKKCVGAMRKSKPGNCQDYRAVEIYRYLYKRLR
jgi:hypothetical protein